MPKIKTGYKKKMPVRSKKIQEIKYRALALAKTHSLEEIQSILRTEFGAKWGLNYIKQIIPSKEARARATAKKVPKKKELPTGVLPEQKFLSGIHFQVPERTRKILYGIYFKITVKGTKIPTKAFITAANLLFQAKTERWNKTLAELTSQITKETAMKKNVFPEELLRRINRETGIKYIPRKRQGLQES